MNEEKPPTSTTHGLGKKPDTKSGPIDRIFLLSRWNSHEISSNKQISLPHGGFDVNPTGHTHRYTWHLNIGLA